MVYVLVRINFFPQIATVDPQAGDLIRRDLSRAALDAGLPARSSRGDVFLFGVGEKSGFDAQRVLDFCFRVAAALESRRQDLAGWNLLLSLREEGPAEEIRAALSHALLSAGEEERIWLEGNCLTLFSDLAETAAQGGLWYLSRRELKAASLPGAFRSTWIRERVAERVLDALGLTLDRERREGILLIVDPLETDRKLAMEQLLERLSGSAGQPPIPRMATLFRRRSALHPFLNSLSPALLEQTPRYLKPVEQAVWAEVGHLLPFLQTGRMELCPDRLETEFYLAYHLYLLAYLRSMEEKLLPGIFVAEDIDTYHPAALASLYLLLQDLSLHPSFLPILVSSQPQLPPELQTLKVRRLSIRHVGRAEMQEVVSALYPGLEIPPAAARQIRRRSGGQLVPLVHYLEYLRRAGKIAGQGERFSWVPRRELDVPFPANPYLAVWNLVESLPEVDRQILYTVYLSAGLLDFDQLLGFLESLEVPVENALRTLRSLHRYGLIHGTGFLIPVFPRIRGRLRARVEGEQGDREERLLAYLWQLWNEGGFNRPVLLYTYLLRKGKAAWALQILPRLLKRKLDEMDLEGAGLFLDARQDGFGERLDDRGRRELRLVVTAGRLRAALLTGSLEAAGRLAAELQDLLVEGAPAAAAEPCQAQCCLQLAACAEAAADFPRALEWAKKSLLAAQQLDMKQEEKQACQQIGSVMLAEGKLAEALEYFSFAEGFDRAFALDEIRALGLQSIALFLQGNLSRAMSVVQRGIRLAASAKRREWEVLLRFLKGRICFEQGGYREALKEFQENLTTASLYSLSPAGEILYCWMARALAYGGDTESAVGLLRRLEDRPEKLYFLAEAWYLLGEEPAAAEALDRAASLERGSAAGRGERIDWRDGFTAVEGRCAALWAGRGLWGRLLAGLRAFLRGGEGAEELHAITRDERIPEADPHLHLYHYYYWKVLPQERSTETDDAITVLNRSLKNLQQRAARIEDSADRYRYLHQNYWNGRILKDAVQRKLI